MESTSGFRFTRFELYVYPTIFIFVTLWAYVKWKSRRFDRLTAKMEGPRSYPIVGNGLYFLGSPENLTDKLIKISDIYSHGPIKVSFGCSQFFICISKPEDIQIVLNNSNSMDKGEIYGLFKNIVGNGLISAPYHNWKKNRRLIAPMFNATLMKQFIPVFNDKTQILIRNLQKEVGKTQPFDLFDYIEPTALDKICQTAMGYNLGTQSNGKSAFVQAVEKVTKWNSMRVYHPWLYPDVIFSIYGKLIGINKYLNTIHALPKQVIKDMKEKYARKKIAKQTNDIVDTVGKKKPLKVFLDVLLELNEAGANLSDQDISDEVVTMMIAGSETSAITVSFCLLLLAIHSDVQDKVYNEIYEVVGDDDHLITIDEIKQLVYLEQVLMETLRVYPTVPLFFRYLNEDVKIGDFTLPKGSTCWISAFSTHHCREWYPNPWTFNSDNFSQENITKRHKYSYIAFSEGPRGCLGNKYAMLSMKIIVSTFLRNFSVHTQRKMSDIKLKIHLLMSSANGYPVTIRHRQRRPTCK